MRKFSLKNGVVKRGKKRSFRAFEDLKIEKFLNHGEGKERG